MDRRRSASLSGERRRQSHPSLRYHAHVPASPSSSPISATIPRRSRRRSTRQTNPFKGSRSVVRRPALRSEVARMDRRRSASLSGERRRQSHPSLRYHAHVPASPSSSPISATIPRRSRRRSTRQTNPFKGSRSVVRRPALRSEVARMDRRRSASLSGERRRQSHPSLRYHAHVPASPSSSPISATIPRRSRRRSTRQTNPFKGSRSVVRRPALRSEVARMDRRRSASLSGERRRQSHPSLRYHAHVPASPSSSPISATIPRRSRRRSTRQTNPLKGSRSVVRRLALRSEAARMDRRRS